MEETVHREIMEQGYMDGREQKMKLYLKMERSAKQVQDIERKPRDSDENPFFSDEEAEGRVKRTV